MYIVLYNIIDVTIMVHFVTGEHLKEKYEGAIEVRVTRRGRLQIRDPRFSLPTASDLVYIDDSPNYCIRNITAGSIGNN
jgi:wingless-type MMTV integration site family protein 5